MANEVVLSPSKIKTWQYCHQAYHYKYAEFLAPKRKTAPLWRGSVIHEIIEAMHLGNDWEAIYNDFETAFNKLFREEREELGENLPEEIWLIVQGYFEHYENDPLRYEAIEGTLGPFPLGDGVFLKGKVDRIAFDADGLCWVVDTKTKKSFPDEKERQMNLQGMIYIWLARQAGYQPMGMIWDYVRTKAPLIPAQLRDGSLTRRKNIDTTWGVYLSEIERLGLDPKDYKDVKANLKSKAYDFYSRVRQPISDDAIEYAVKLAHEQGLRILEYGDDPIREFNWQCPRCEYQKLCWAEFSGLDSEFIRRTDYELREGGEADASDQTED